MTSSQTFVGRTAVVTGASSGIGRATAVALGKKGASLMLLGRRNDALLETAAMVPGGRVETLAGDLREDAFVERAMATPDRLDVLICTAGVVMPDPFLDGRPEDWRAMLDTNVLASIVAIRTAAQRMRDQGSGHVVLIGSALSTRPMANAAIYATCKAAVHMLSRCLRIELAAYGIRVSEVSPGLVGDTQFKRHTSAGPLADSFDDRPYAPIASADVARAVVYALESPPGVSVDFLEVMPEGQF